MPQTNDGLDITDRIEWLMEQWQTRLGIRWIHYGNDITIPDTPAVVIEPARRTKELTGTSLQVTNTFEVAIFVYATSLNTGAEGIQRAADSLTAEVEKVIDQDAIPATYGGTQFDGLLIHGHCTEIDYGWLRANDRVLRANRIMFTGMSKTKLIIDG